MIERRTPLVQLWIVMKHFCLQQEKWYFLPALLQHNAYKNDPARPSQVRENMKLLKTVALVAIEAQNGMK